MGYSSGNTGPTHSVGDKEGFQLCVGPRVVKDCAAGPGWVQKFLLLGPYELADPILLEGKVQHRLLGFGAYYL